MTRGLLDCFYALDSRCSKTSHSLISGYSKNLVRFCRDLLSVFEFLEASIGTSRSMEEILNIKRLLKYIKCENEALLKSMQGSFTKLFGKIQKFILREICSSESEFPKIVENNEHILEDRIDICLINIAVMCSTKSNVPDTSIMIRDSLEEIIKGNKAFNTEFLLPKNAKSMAYMTFEKDYDDVIEQSEKIFTEHIESTAWGNFKESNISNSPEKEYTISTLALTLPNKTQHFISPRELSPISMSSRRERVLSLRSGTIETSPRVRVERSNSYKKIAGAVFSQKKQRGSKTAEKLMVGKKGARCIALSNSCDSLYFGGTHGINALRKIDGRYKLSSAQLIGHVVSGLWTIGEDLVVYQELGSNDLVLLNSQLGELKRLKGIRGILHCNLR